MKLYHGTNVSFNSIMLSKCRPCKDFGRGFYLTDIKSQAEEMAHRRTMISRGGTPVVLEFSFDDNLLNDEKMNVLHFHEPSVEWAEFILENRMIKDFQHNYDIVIGPVADDGVVLQLDLYTRHLITLEQLVKELTYRKLNRQYCFSTENAISKLMIHDRQG